MCLQGFLQFPANRSGLLKYSTKMESVMWGRSYYLDVQGAGDVVTRPRQCGQNGFCMIRPLSHGLDMPTSDLRDIGKTEIQAKHTTILYLHIFFQVWTPPSGFVQIDVVISLSHDRKTQVWVHTGQGKSFRWLLVHKSWAQARCPVGGKSPPFAGIFHLFQGDVPPFTLLCR